jgi:hypothetical protein
MSNLKRTKKCKRCGSLKPIGEFVDVSGSRNPRGRYCHECHLERVGEWEEEQKAEKESKIRKLKIIYGKWWRHYCLPQEFAGDIYAERDFCPYCGKKLPPQYIGNHPELGTFRGRAHLDHMDPLELGGEDSIRNVVYVCDECNYKKGTRSFLYWLATLPPAQAKISRGIYEEKQDRPPEQFVPGEPTGRCDGIAGELLLDEKELRKLYPTPMVDGPPSNQSISVKLKLRVDEHGKLVVDTNEKH